MSIGALPLLAFGLLQGYRWQQVTTANDDARMMAQVEILHDKMERLFEVRMTALELVAESLRTKPRLVGPGAYETLRYHVLKFELATAGIMNVDGINLESYSVTPGFRKKFANRSMRYTGIWDILNKTRSPSFTGIRAGAVTPLHISVLAAPIWDPSRKRIRGAVGSSVLMDEVQEIADEAMKSTPHLRFVILDQNKTVAASSLQKSARGPLRYVRSDLYAPVRSNLTVVRQGLDEAGVPSRGAVIQLELYNAIWTIGVTESLEYLHRHERSAWVQTLIGLGTILIISIALAHYAGGLIASPILHMIDAMKLIGSGEYQQWKASEERPFGFRETNRAWASLSDMARMIADHRENLETRIRERTQELVNTHQALDEQRARAFESARLASLGEMAGGIAHEINTPLGSLLILSADIQDMVASGYVELQATATAAGQIQEITSRIARIINGLRALSRDSEMDPPQKASLRSIIENTLDLCRQRFANYGIELRVAAPPPTIELECRSVQISQAVLNLINNAFDAVQAQSEKWVAIDVTEKMDSVEIRISDSGPGVPENLREKIFQPFFTTKEIGKGTGLGLSVSSRIAESHHGRLFIEPGPGPTTFVLTLPKIQPRAQDRKGD